MKPHRSFIAFVIAVAVHALILFALLGLEEKNDEIPKINKRFGLHLWEATVAEEASQPLQPSVPQSTDIIQKQLRPLKPQKSPARNVIADISPPSIGEVSEPPPRSLTRADTESLPPSVIHHYGETFFELSAGEQHYIIDNLQRIRKINEIVGTRLLRERPDDEIDPDDSNLVEFYLQPDGSISDLHLQKNRIGTPLDELTLQTIKLAHTRYPKPEQTTLIRIRVYIVVK